MPTLASRIDKHAADLLRSGAVSCPAEAQRRAEAFFAAELAALPDLHKVFADGAGGPL